MTYDVFMFMNELDLLEIRLHELEKVVDAFVICEATRTFTYNPKPLNFPDHAERFKAWHDKIIYLSVENIPENATPSQREEFNRNISIDRMRRQLCDRDIIICSDIDEIPRASVVTAYRPEMGVCGLDQSMYRYYLNCLTPDRWVGPKIVPMSLMRTPHFHRWYQEAAGCRFIDNGGWHFTSTGGPEAFAYKLANFAHAGKPWHSEEVENVRNGTCAEKYNLKIVAIDETYPKFVRENMEMMKKWGLIYEGMSC